MLTRIFLLSIPRPEQLVKGIDNFLGKNGNHVLNTLRKMPGGRGEPINDLASAMGKKDRNAIGNALMRVGGTNVDKINDLFEELEAVDRKSAPASGQTQSAQQEDK